MRSAFEHAAKIFPHLNLKQANFSENRSLSTVEIDNLSGIIAELACERILVFRYGRDKILKPESNTSRNQVDLKLYNGRTIEVRSSCVRNGLDFALFARNRAKPREQFFDVIGPYSNAYKQGETYKDYYMRVLYECGKEDFMNLLKRPFLRLFITGGADKEMMMDPHCYQIKHLTPAGGQVRTESDYRVIPLAESLDINEFFDVLEKQNRELQEIKR